MPQVKETNWDLLVSGEELKKVSIPKCKDYIEITVPNNEVENYYECGWTNIKTGKKTSKLSKLKATGDAFEDEVWSIFYKMGFTTMNKSNDFAIVYGEATQVSKQIDVVAIDSETCLLIECKESEKYDHKRNLQKDINEVPSYYNKCCNAIRKLYPNLKFKYIFATKNIDVSQVDKDRMKENKIVHFDYATILYYKALVSHLGSAAKYQLLGQLFAGNDVISKEESKIPAIRGKMGIYTYYSFVISPQKLLKIAYILHKTNANNDYEELLPSYQRLIKKDRLKSIREFVNGNGFFPNSIVISIDAPKGPLQFDDVPKEYNRDHLTKMGILHLPQKYQSAYIIDGQHRLYGYSDSEHSENNSIPVVAFENLDKNAQLKLFMDINLNQKPVPKALRNILEIDVFYGSKDPQKAQQALFGKIAKRLGEDSHSALKGRVVIGEDAATARCCITIENLKLALSKTRLFNKIKKNGEVTKHGILDKDDKDKTFKAVYELLSRFINTIRDSFATEWEKDGSFYVSNNIVGAYIRLFDDIISIIYEKDRAKFENPAELKEAIENYLLILLEVLGNLKAEERDEIKKQRGAAAPTNAYRLLQMKMHELDDEFSNSDIEEYYSTHYKNYNDDAQPKLVTIKNNIFAYLKSTFVDSGWMNDCLAQQHESDLINRINAKSIDNRRKGIKKEVTVWDEFNFSDLEKMINYGTNWTTYFKTKFNEWLPNENKHTVIGIIKIVSKCYDHIQNGRKITGLDFKEIVKLYESMVGQN